ncbi:MAG: hypothetical protein U5N56_13535 [Candidatus Marinimicrobia bacterium]|nr:hypothetical protein [Candidatus Neomarinimicrobiota bacterium]
MAATSFFLKMPASMLISGIAIPISAMIHVMIVGVIVMMRFYTQEISSRMIFPKVIL